MIKSHRIKSVRLWEILWISMTPKWRHHQHITFRYHILLKNPNHWISDLIWLALIELISDAIWLHVTTWDWNHRNQNSSYYCGFNNIYSKNANFHGMLSIYGIKCSLRAISKYIVLIKSLATNLSVLDTKTSFSLNPRTLMFANTN